MTVGLQSVLDVGYEEDVSLSNFKLGVFLAAVRCCWLLTATQVLEPLPVL